MKSYNQELEFWINSVVTDSKNRWFISVFKVNGSIKDNSGCNRRVVNQLSLGRFYKAIDWTISSTRRNRNFKTMKFIPFIGGDKESGITPHIHGFIEIPDYEMKWELHDRLKRNWSSMCRHSFKTEVDSELWLNELDISRTRNHSKYCLRYEGNTFLNGTEKVLFELDSCLL